MDELLYLERRAAEEEAAAEATECREARCAHLALAERYQRMARDIAAARARPDPQPAGRD
jgi:hypothetical protein